MSYREHCLRLSSYSDRHPTEGIVCDSLAIAMASRCLSFSSEEENLQTLTYWRATNGNSSLLPHMPFLKPSLLPTEELESLVGHRLPVKPSLETSREGNHCCQSHRLPSSSVPLHAAVCLSMLLAKYYINKHIYHGVLTIDNPSRCPLWTPHPRPFHCLLLRHLLRVLYFLLQLCLHLLHKKWLPVLPFLSRFSTKGLLMW